MANFVFNVAKGRVAELVRRVDANDPSTAILVIMAINTSATDATLMDLDTFAAIESDANTAEVTNTGYARKILADTDVTTPAPDDTNDRMPVDIADQTWTAVSAGDAWTDLVIGYIAAPAAAGEAADNANIIPLTLHDFAVTPNGGDITAQVADFFRATQPA